MVTASAARPGRHGMAIGGKRAMESIDHHDALLEELGIVIELGAKTVDQAGHGGPLRHAVARLLEIEVVDETQERVQPGVLDTETVYEGLQRAVRSVVTELHVGQVVRDLTRTQRARIRCPVYGLCRQVPF